MSYTNRDGLIRRVRHFLDQSYNPTETCLRCGGRGHNSRGDWCWVCRGTGKVKRKEQR